MSKFNLAVLCAVIAGTVASPAVGEAKSLQRTYTDVRVVVVHKHGARAAGRNIRRFGVKTEAGVRPATSRDLAKSIRVLRRLVHPRQYLMPVGAGPPAVPPSMAMTAVYQPSGTAACIVQRESTGNPMASNSSGHSGLAGWSAEAWSRMGGTRFAPSPTQATRQQQLQVLSDGLARYGCRDWCPFDGC